MNVGFTGSRRGMTEKQYSSLAALLRRLRPATFHHGDCVGADAEAHQLAAGLGAELHVHPPVDPRLRAWCQADVLYPPAPYLTRDRQIVDAAQLLVACPAGPEVVRSGTWATIRYARGRVETIILF